MLDPSVVKENKFKAKKFNFKDNKGFEGETKKNEDEKNDEEAEEDQDTAKEGWVKENCVVIHHDSGTGRTLLCQNKKVLATKIKEFLENDVRAISKNCEFLARHLRYEREKISRFVEKAKLAFGGGDKKAASAPAAA